MSEAVERQWNVRDAVLKWLYVRTAEGAHAPVPKVDNIMEVVDWEGDPITDEEVAKATNHLKERGFIKGPSAMGAGVIRPIITAEGELHADRNVSVRDKFEARVPANTTNNIVVHGNASGNFSAGGTNVTQSFDATVAVEKVNAVADMLAKAVADRGVDDEQAREASEIVEALQAEARQSNWIRVREFLGKAFGAAGLAAATTGGEAFPQLVMDAMQSLPM
ncbi:hypothetical protein Rruber_05556 (plasmid) [Rhodococcus ruber]|uniref:hypothetical protein n=1 Tax=Rhodococcus ruber TaxID=1830 RepID=UPI00315D4EB9